MTCETPAIRKVAPMMTERLMSMRPAALLPVGVELLELDAFVPWPPGFATLPEHWKLPLITCLEFLSAMKALQSNCPELCMLKAP